MRMEYNNKVLFLKILTILLVFILMASSHSCRLDKWELLELENDSATVIYPFMLT
jgi:hypothetical protein